MQVLDGSTLKCVAVMLTPNAGGTGIDVVATGAYNMEGSIGDRFLNDDGTTADGVSGDVSVGAACDSERAYSLYGLNVAGKTSRTVSVSGDTTMVVGTDIASAYSTLTVAGDGTLTVVGNMNADALVVEDGATVMLADNFGARTVSAAEGATVAYAGGEGSSFDWASISGAGAVEIRSGVVCLRQANVSLSGGITVKSGAKLKPGNERAFGPQADTTWVAVEDGGTVDMAGQPAFASFRIAGDGEGDGALVNTGSGIGNTKAQTRSIELTADASVGGTANFGMIANNYNAVKLKFPAEGATLVKKGGNAFWMCNVTRDATGGEGTVRVDAGSLNTRYGAVDLSGVTLVFNGGTLGGDAALAVSQIDIESGTPCNGFGSSLAADTVNVNAGGFARNAATTVATLNVAGGASANINSYVQPDAVAVAQGGEIVFGNWSAANAIDYSEKTVSGGGTIKIQGGESSMGIVFADETIAGFSGGIEMSENGKLVLGEAGFVGKGGVTVSGSSAIAASGGTMPLDVRSVASGATLAVTDAQVHVGVNRPAGTIAFSDGDGACTLSVEFADESEKTITLAVSGDLTTEKVYAYKPGGVEVETEATKTIENGTLVIALPQPHVAVASFSYDAYLGGGGIDDGSAWFTSWSGERLSDVSLRLGPSAEKEYVRHTTSSAHPWVNFKPAGSFSLALYADVSQVPSGAKAALAVFGTHNNTATPLFAIYRQGGNVVAAVHEGNGTLRGSAAGVAIPSGFHLYVATLDVETGDVQLFLDGNAAETASAGSAVALGTGFQVGSIHGGLASGFSKGAGMALCSIRGYDAVLDADDVAELASALPATDGLLRRDVVFDESDKTLTVYSAVEADGTTASFGVASGTVVLADGAEVRASSGIAVSGTVSLLGTATMAGPVALSGGSKICLADAPLTVDGSLTLPLGANMTIDPGGLDLDGESAALIAGVAPSEALADGKILAAVSVVGYPYCIVAAKGNGDTIDVVPYENLPVESDGADAVAMPISWVAGHAAMASGIQNPTTIAELCASIKDETGANGLSYLHSYALGLDPNVATSKPRANIAIVDGNVELFFDNVEVPSGVVVTVTAVTAVQGEEPEAAGDPATLTHAVSSRVRFPKPAASVRLYRLNASVSGSAE